MNCNKKSHFDGVTPVHRQGGGGAGFGYVSVCKEEELSQALESKMEQRKGRDMRSGVRKKDEESAEVRG